LESNKKSIFLIDFDITISKKDSTDVLLEAHQPEFKKELRKRYRAGEFSIREFIKNNFKRGNYGKHLE